MSNSLSKNSISYYIWSAIALFCMFGFRIFPAVEPITEVGVQVVGVFLGMIVGWCTVGLFWPSVIGIIALGFTGYTTPLGAFQSAVTNVNVIYLMFLFVFVGFLKQSGIVYWIAYKMINLKFAQGKPWVLSFLLLQVSIVITAIVDPFTSLLLVWEIFYAICNAAGVKGESKFVRFNIAAILMAVSMGSGILYFKFPYILLANLYETISAAPLQPAKWMLYFFVMGEVTTIVFWLVGKYVLRCEAEKFKNISVSDVLQNKSLSGYQKIVMAILAAYMLCMLLPSFVSTQSGFVGVLRSLGNPGITAIACAILVFCNFAEGISYNEAAKASFSWDLYFIVAAAILIASALTDSSTGISAFLVMKAQPFLSGAGVIVFVIAIVVLAGFLTGVLNSIVVGMVFTQIAYTCAVAAGIDHYPICYAVLFVINFAFFTPAGSALAPLYFGRTEWIGSTGNATKYGLLITLVGILVTLCIGLPFGYLLF